MMEGADWPEDDSREFLESDPSSEGLARLGSALGGGEVRVITRLVGGLDCATHVLLYRGHHLVLKRHKPGATGARIEFENLQVVRASAVATPEPVALDEDGEWFETEALVMTVLPGRPELSPVDTDGWVRQLATALAGLHDTEAARLPPRRESLWRRWEAWLDPRDERMAAIIVAVEVLRQTADSEPLVLSHCDYHPGNVLFEHSTLSGVVDWMGARLEPR